jgi:formylglycine-generating enzyme required for sulfatase activity
MSQPPAARRWRRVGLAVAVAVAVLVTIVAAGLLRQHAGEPQRCALPDQAPGWPHPGMVWVPGGSFEMGDTVYAEEQPIRTTTVDGFWMSRTETSNDEFAAFVAATGYVTLAERPVAAAFQASLPPEMRQPGAVVFVMPQALDNTVDVAQWWRYVPGANWRHPGGPDTHIDGRGAWPVVAVTLEDAQAYARWTGQALPSEAQWEWAARAGQALAAQDHAQPAQANTWQGVFPLANSATDGFAGLAPVACFAPNALGLYDMIGNVWELTRDVWRPDHAAAGAPAPDNMSPPRPAGMAAQHVIKGGSFLCAPNYCARYRSGSRQPQDDDLGTSHLGFRTILIAPGP